MHTHGRIGSQAPIFRFSYHDHNWYEGHLADNFSEYGPDFSEYGLEFGPKPNSRRLKMAGYEQ